MIYAARRDLQRYKDQLPVMISWHPVQGDGEREKKGEMDRWIDMGYHVRPMFNRNPAKAGLESKRILNVDGVFA